MVLGSSMGITSAFGHANKTACMKADEGEETADRLLFVILRLAPLPQKKNQSCNSRYASAQPK